MRDGQVPTLAQLAVAWSGGQRRPQCQDRGPRGEYLTPGLEQYCVWPAPAGVRVRGGVSAHTSGSGRPMFVQWDRPTDGVSDADRIVDSLKTALAAHGVPWRACPSGDVPAGHVELTEWDAPNLLVQLSRITPASGIPNLMVLATDQPKAIPDLLCPRDEQR